MPPPRARTLHRRKGWVASTVRDILHNATYIGDRTFKRKQWMKIPGTNVRRYRARPSSDVIRRVDPKLRVIDEDTWNQAKERLEKVRAAYTRTAYGQPKGRALDVTTS